jgi:YVTN family beta-propeller protein
VVDRDTDHEVKVIPVGKSPQALAVRLRDPLVAVANSRAQHATLIDPLTLEALPEGVPTGMGPEDVVFTPDGRQLVATSYYDKTVTFTDLETRSLVGEPLRFPGAPRRLLLSADGSRLFVLLREREGGLAVVDLAARRTERVLPAGTFPFDLALAPDGRRVFVASFDDQAVLVLDPSTDTPAERLKLAVGFGIALHPSRPLLYSALGFEAAVLVFDYAAGRPVATIPVGGSPAGEVVTREGFLYVINDDGDSLAKIDTATNTVVVRVAVGAEPQALVAFDRPRRPSGAVIAAGLAAAVLAGVVGVVLRRRAHPRAA